MKYLIILILFNITNSTKEERDEAREKKINLGESLLLTPSSLSEFEEILKDNKHVLTVFDSSNCNNCSKWRDHYKLLAAELYDFQNDVPLVYIDAAENFKITDKYSILEIKTRTIFYFFTNGKPELYRSDRDLGYMVKWVHHEVHPTSTEINTLEEVEKLKDEFISVLLLTPENCLVVKTYKEIGKHDKTPPLFHTSKKELIKDYNSKNKYVLIVFRNFDKTEILAQNTPFRANEMSGFIRKYKYPDIVDFTDDINYRVKSYKIPAFVLVTDHDKDHTFRIFKDFCRLYRHKVICTVSIKSNFSDFEHIDHLRSYIKIIEYEDQRIKKFNLDTVRMSELNQAYKDWENSNLNHYIISEKEPSLVHNSDIKDLVGDTFDKKITAQKDYDSFVHLYSPDFKDLKNHENEYKHLSYIMRGKGVKMFRMNRDKNFHFKMDGQGPSQVYFFDRNGDGFLFEGKFFAGEINQFYKGIKEGFRQEDL